MRIIIQLNPSMQYYVINLKRRPDRLRLFKEHYPLDVSNVHIFEAIDGKELENIPRSFPILLLATSIFACISPRVLYRIIKDNFKKKGVKKIPIFVEGLHPGEIGVFLSHKALWESILRDTQSNYGVIFEDDAIFSKDFKKEFEQILLSFPNFDTILYFGGRFQANYKMKTCVKVNEKIVKYDYNKPWDPWDCDRGAFGYIISKSLRVCICF